MKLREIFGHILESEVIVLTYNGQFIGLRLRVFDVDATAFNYFDFDKKYVEDKQMQTWLTNNMNNFKRDELIAHNDLLMTRDEASGAVDVRELLSAKDVADQLKKVYEVYNYNMSQKKR